MEMTGETVDNFKKDEGYEYDGTTYETAEELVLTGMLDFCGCGAPDAAGKFLMNTLQGMKDFHDSKITWEERDAKFSDEGVRYFVYYILEKEGLTEHGTSVNGSWLTDKGNEILTYLKEIYED
jgi:hypothetical protein